MREDPDAPRFALPFLAAVRRAPAVGPARACGLPLARPPLPPPPLVLAPLPPPPPFRRARAWSGDGGSARCDGGGRLNCDCRCGLPPPLPLRTTGTDPELPPARRASDCGPADGGGVVRRDGTVELSEVALTPALLFPPLPPEPRDRPKNMFEKKPPPPPESGSAVEVAAGLASPSPSTASS